MNIEKELLQKDINILELIEMKSKRYFEGTFNTAGIANYFNDYLDQLTYVDDTWKKNFFSLWEIVEAAYAMSLYEGHEELTDRRHLTVNNAVTSMQQMASEKLPELRALKDKLFPRDPYEL